MDRTSVEKRERLSYSSEEIRTEFFLIVINRAVEGGLPWARRGHHAEAPSRASDRKMQFMFSGAGEESFAVIERFGGIADDDTEFQDWAMAEEAGQGVL